jgi:hypothetical protein
MEREIGLLLVRLAVSHAIAGKPTRFKAGETHPNDYLNLVWPWRGRS